MVSAGELGHRRFSERRRVSACAKRYSYRALPPSYRPWYLPLSSNPTFFARQVAVQSASVSTSSAQSPSSAPVVPRRDS